MAEGHSAFDAREKKATKHTEEKRFERKGARGLLCPRRGAAGQEIYDGRGGNKTGPSSGMNKD